MRITSNIILHERRLRLSKKYILSFSLLFLVGFAFFFDGCANQLPPNGGPIDATPPQITKIYPDSNARNFSDDHIRLEFDRYVDERSVEEAVFISPYIKNLEFDWSGTSVTISFLEKLQRNTTYVVNIGTDVTDLYRNQMRMSRTYTMAFSTGPDIDRGGIEGLVFPVKETDLMSGIMIFAYRLNGLNPDTLNPMTARPDFITQTGRRGDFFLHHIPFGNYRIFAIRDEYRNLVYDREVDEFGVQSGIINITPDDTLSTGILMKLTKEDITGPRLVKAAAPDKNHVVAELSKSINPESVTLSSFSIIDTLNRNSLQCLSVYPSPSTQSSIVIVTQKQDSGKAYRLKIQSITDSSGNIINPLACSLVFQGSSKADTLGPRLVSVSIADSVRGIDLKAELSLIFSDAVAKTTSLDFVNILDNRRQPVPAEKKWNSNVMVSLRPEKEFMNRTWYTLRAELRGVHNWEGRICHDTTKQWRFETFDLEDVSSIEGIISDTNTSDIGGRLYVTAVQTGEKAAKNIIVPADAAGNFLFPQVAEGHYIIQAFRDRNNNGRYDGGKPFPFAASERLSPLSDTLKVRARWPLEGVKIQMK